MIYLIGGPPRCGKTTLAERFAATIRSSWLSVDYLSTVVSGYIPQDELQSRYPSLEVPRNNDLRYARYTAAEVIDNYCTKAATTWPGLRWFIEYALGDGRDFVLEGYQVEPRFVQELQNAEGHERIRAVFLYREDVSDIAESIQKGTDPNDWALRTTHETSTFERIASMIGQYGGWFRDEAIRYGFATFNMDHNFQGQLVRAMDYLAHAPEGNK